MNTFPEAGDEAAFLRGLFDAAVASAARVVRTISETADIGFLMALVL